MKKYLNNLVMIAAVTMVMSSCKKEGTDVTFKGGTAPALSSTAGDSIALSSDTKDDEAVTFKWTNPNYEFSNGISSLNVTYNLEFDTAGANFSSHNMQTIQISPDLSKSFTVGDLNSLIANKLQLAVGMSHTIEVRVLSLIAPYTSSSPSISPLTSNVVSFKAAPYAPPPVVDPPASGTLFLVGGDSKLGGWANPVPASQQFTQVSNTDYQIITQLSGGDPTNGADQYLILPVNGSWSHKYACKNTSTQPLSGGTFGLDLSSNFPGPTASGTYKIEVNFQSGIITVTKQ